MGEKIKNTIYYNELKKEVINIYNELKMNNDIVLEVCFKIIEYLCSNNIKDVKISKTPDPDNEILIYTKEGDLLRNILIDNEGYLAFSQIGTRMLDDKLVFFPNIQTGKEIDYNELISFFL